MQQRLIAVWHRGFVVAAVGCMVVGCMDVRPEETAMTSQALDQAAYDRIRPVTYFNPKTWERRPFYPIGWYGTGVLNCAEPRPDCAQGQTPGSGCVQRYCMGNESSANCRYVIPSGVSRDIRCGASPGASDGDDLAAIAAMGANTVLLPEIGYAWSNAEYLARTKYTLDVAQLLGLKVVLQLHSRLLQSDLSWHPKSCYGGWPSDGNDTCNDADPHTSCAQNRAALTDWVIALRDHPALLAWELGDEDTSWERISLTDPQTVRGSCDSVMPGEMQSAASWIHELDPNRQLWQVVSDESNDQQTANYMVGTDVFSHDPYYWLDQRPDLEEPSHSQAVSVGRTIGMFQRDADWASRSYGFSLAGYAGNVNILQGWAGYTEDCGELNRFPTAVELRWSAFAGLASGAKRGTIAWHYNPGGYCTSGNADAFVRNSSCVLLRSGPDEGIRSGLSDGPLLRDN